MRQRPTEADCRRLDRPDLDPKSAQWPRLERPLSRNPLIFPSPSARVPTWRRALSFSEAVDGLGAFERQQTWIAVTIRMRKRPSRTKAG
jgi:hypothetical protein